MNTSKFNGSAQITDEGIKKHFKSLEPVNAIFELVWNGFDANAKVVDINIEYNNLNGLEKVSIIDNGEGIDIENTVNNFGKFNESSKKLDDNKHGSHGKGRLAFHKLCDIATWYTKRGGYNAKLIIKSSAIKDFSGEYLEEDKQEKSLKELATGTCVVLSEFTNYIPQNLDKLVGAFSKEFGWYLALNKGVQLRINGQVVSIPNHEVHEHPFEVRNISFTAKIIRWDDKPSSEKSFNYLITGDYKVVKKELSKFNNKFAFYTSSYVFSKWADQYDECMLELDQKHTGQTQVYNAVLKELLAIQRDIYSDYLRSFVDSKIERFDKEGYFPSYSGLAQDYAKWRKNNTKTILRDLYFAEPTVFNTLNAKQTKIIIRLLDVVLVSNENNSLFEVLNEVLDLDEENLSTLAKQLQRTTLENIISTIESLQKRQVAVHKLRNLMEYRYSELLETPDLQKIIEANTWLFGAQYTTLGAEEVSFTSVAKNLRDKVDNIDIVSQQDIEDGMTVEGANRQVDLFMARKVPTFGAMAEEIFKCVIVEIKRPSISLNKKHLQQLEDYAEIISKHPAFSSAKMNFELILVGRKISQNDYQIKKRLEDLKDKGEYGLISDGKIKCYIKDWFTIFDEFELSNNYLLSCLNTKLESYTDVQTDELITALQKTG